MTSLKEACTRLPTSSLKHSKRETAALLQAEGVGAGSHGLDKVGHGFLGQGVIVDRDHGGWGVGFAVYGYAWRSGKSGGAFVSPRPWRVMGGLSLERSRVDGSLADGV